MKVEKKELEINSSNTMEETSQMDSPNVDNNEKEVAATNVLTNILQRSFFAEWLKKENAVRIGIGMFVVLLLFWAFADSPSQVDKVKNGTLFGYEQTTIGRAFDSFFDKPHWEAFETKNGIKVVEFTGQLPQDYHDSIFGQVITTYPKGGHFKMQFMLKSDDIQIVYGEVHTIIPSSILDYDGEDGVLPLDEDSILSWINLIYQGGN